MQKRYHFLKISVFVHATEDRPKVLEALKNLIGESLPENVEENPFEGVHGNPIRYISVEFTRSRDIRRVLSFWEGSDFWKEAKYHLEDRLDEDLTFHVRVDKMEAYNGNLLLWKEGGSIDIQLKPATFPASRDGARTIILEGPLE